MRLYAEPPSIEESRRLRSSANFSGRISGSRTKATECFKELGPVGWGLERLAKRLGRFPSLADGLARGRTTAPPSHSGGHRYTPIVMPELRTYHGFISHALAPASDDEVKAMRGRLLSLLGAGSELEVFRRQLVGKHLESQVAAWETDCAALLDAATQADLGPESFRAVLLFDRHGGGSLAQRHAKAAHGPLREAARSLLPTDRSDAN